MKVRFFRISKLGRHMRQWHALVAPQWDGDGINGGIQDALKGTLITACACHDIHSSFKWSLHLALGDADLIRDCYIGVGQQHLQQILTFAGQWVTASLTIGAQWEDNWTRSCATRAVSA